MKSIKRKIWEKPWDYIEGFIIAIGIIFVGFSLQFSIGNIQTSEFAFPVNLFIGALFIIGLLCCHFLFKDNHIVKWLSSIRATMPALAMMLLLIVLLGVTPQYPVYESAHHLPDNFIRKIGWYKMTTSWSFVLMGFYLLTILGLSTLKKTRKPQSWKLIGFYLNHVGLFIAFLGGILGSTDMQRLTITVNEGEVEWRGQDYYGNVHDLPIAIELDTFKIEEYLPKLVIIDNNTGKILPEGRPETYMFEEVGKTTQLVGNTIEILEYLPQAAVMQDSAFSKVVPFYMDGSAVALKVKVSSPSLSEPIEGWVSNGSYLFPYKVLYIDENTSVAMPIQEVKKYTSHVKVFTEDGHSKETTIEVNKPLSIDDWMIYQFSYDETMGKYSKTSIFELVRDPWLKVIYTGIFMLIAGSLFMFTVGAPKKSTLQNKEKIES